MPKLNTYQLQPQLAATLQLIGIIPGAGSSFDTVRLSNAALVAFVQQYAGEDGNDGREIELRRGTTNIEWRYVGVTAWTTLIAVSELKGDAGEQVQLQTSATHIQWKYSSSATWTNLVALTSLAGANGTNGRTMWSVTGAPSGALGVDGDFANDVTNSVMYGPKTSGSWGAGVSYKGLKGDTGTGLTNRSAWVTGTTYQPGDYVFSTGSATTSSMWILNGTTPYVSNTLPKDDLTKWVEFVAPAGEDGVDGKSVELRKTATAIQWRLVGDAAWVDLVTLADIKGADGKQVELRVNAYNFEWRYVGDAGWTVLGPTNQYPTWKDNGSKTGTTTINMTEGESQRVLVGGTGNLAFSNWPPAGKLGNFLLELVNGAAFAFTFPSTINWIKADGTVTNTFADLNQPLQTAGTDWILFWSRDAGATVWAKVIR